MQVLSCCLEIPNIKPSSRSKVTPMRVTLTFELSALVPVQIFLATNMLTFRNEAPQSRPLRVGIAEKVWPTWLWWDV